jgi:hypothetical protein
VAREFLGATMMTGGGECDGLESGIPGDALLSAHESWVRGAPPPPDSPGLPADAFQAIVEFHRRIVTRGEDEPLVLCRGVSCRLHGAEALHAALKARLESAGVLGRIVEVHCLSQCNDGPNLKLGSSVLCLGTGRVVTDERPWRPDSAGPKPVEPAAPASP